MSHWQDVNWFMRKQLVVTQPGMSLCGVFPITGANLTLRNPDADADLSPIPLSHHNQSSTLENTSTIETITAWLLY
jgi:hypothetical protein